MIAISRSLAIMRASLQARRNAADGEKGVALLTALLFMIIMVSVSVVLVSVVLGQTTPSYLAQKGTTTIYAAQTGLQTALGVFRSAALNPDPTGHVYGNTAALPCALTGNVDGSNDGIKYSVGIRYFSEDPTGKPATWQIANDLCSGSGVNTQPKYAMITSQGTAPGVPNAASSTTGDRTLSAVYKFKVAQVNLIGGRIYDHNKAYCLEAVTATAGSLVRFVAAAQCTNDALELWVYDTDYKIKLAATTVSGAAGLCITGPVNYGGATQNAILQPCLSKTDPLRWNQLWSWSGSDSWQGQNISITQGYSNACLATGYAAGTALTGKYLQVAQGCNGSFAPSAQVGAGAAGYGTHQIVNFKEFGRCADVTSEDINATYEISYPCKQDPSGTGSFLLWNHKWFYTEPSDPVTSLVGQIYVYYKNNTANKYCLTSPKTGAGNNPVFAACSGSAQQNWTRVYNTGTYATSYLFIDSYNRCLSVDATNLHSGLYSKLSVAQCNGTDEQKWNAPAIYTSSTVGGFKEGSP